ncbi:MAG: ATP-binding protein [Chlamydiae bacterium]|nr:ATP-binding protein [Chlamydiota bacterium]
MQEGIPLLIFDEIHKYPMWKDFLKGLYDTYPHQMHILVTGSARLDVYKRGGDSLMGRYFRYRLHPLSIGEILRSSLPLQEISAPSPVSDTAFENIWKFGGYPDPYLKANTRFANRWKQLRLQQLFQEDVRGLTRIQELAKIELLAQLLKNQASKQTNYESLAKSIRVCGSTVRHWIEALHNLYYCFAVRPWSRNISRSLLKEPKYYLWDWSELEDPGAKAENFVASHLLKAVHFWTDFGWGDYGLYYLRDKDQREVDFLVTKNEVPWFLVEVKLSRQSLSPSLTYFQGVTGAQHAFQVTIDLPYVEKNCFTIKQPVIVPARTLLSQLI